MYCLLVGSKHTLGTKTIGIICSIDVPQPTNIRLTYVLRDSSKAIRFEAAVSGIRRHHIAYLKDSLLILVHVSVVPDFV